MKIELRLARALIGAVPILFLPSQAALARQPQGAAPQRVASPDGKVVVTFQMRGERPLYRVDYEGKEIIADSALGFEPGFSGSMQVAKITSSDQHGEWENLFGERRRVPDNYRELAIDLKNAAGRTMHVTFRAYDEGAAFRYRFPDPPADGSEHRFTAEKTEFAFPEGTFGWEEHASEGDYRRVKIEDMEPQIERPLTLEYASGVYASLAEAANAGFPRMLLSRQEGAAGGGRTLVPHLGGTTLNTVGRGGLGGVGTAMAGYATVTLKPGESTPWRMLIVGEKPGDLLERNYLMLNLNGPSAITDTSWIRPGKAMRDSTLTTANAKAIVDAGPRLGLDYVGFDAHWYGPDDAGDGTTIRAPNLDIKEVAAYAKAHGMGVCVYVDARQVRKQMDVMLPLFKQWGVDALKIGFVPAGPQAETAWITSILEKTAAYKYVLDIHDGYRATGNNRTWPNLLTVEGIQGNEHFPTAAHDCTLPFTRYIAGPGDYTVCYYDVRIKNTHAHQLAMGVVSFSPMQWLYWYDRPSMYQGEPELEFWVHLPTVWDETRVVNGRIGEYATIARRKGAEWFIGTINGMEARTLKVPLEFLEKGKKFTAHLYEDDDAAATRTKVGVSVKETDSATVLDVPLKPSGGHAIWIEAGK